LWEPVREIVAAHLKPGDTFIDVGCGSGFTAAALADMRLLVTAVDPSTTGIQVATAAYPKVRFAERSAYDDLAKEYGVFHGVVSLEVVEHCYWPRMYAKCVFDLLQPGGVAIISTPFHGYWKNLAMELAGKCDAHWAALWDGGHIKFWSESTLGVLLRETGFVDIRFQRVGKIRPFAKSMIAVAKKPL